MPDFLLLFLLKLLGFGPLGPIAGSFAVWFQFFFGPVPAGGWFALFQSAAMGGLGREALMKLFYTYFARLVALFRLFNWPFGYWPSGVAPPDGFAATYQNATTVQDVTALPACQVAILESLMRLIFSPPGLLQELLRNMANAAYENRL
ncbi:hypothetical protein IWZ00DRAFT_549199 [Phyllosticta capitalensis]